MKCGGIPCTLIFGLPPFVFKPILTDRIYENKWSFNYGLEWKINEQAVIDESKTDGLFPLITNNHLLNTGEVLRMYKRQAYLEKRMYTKKSILDVAPVFLKKERRIEAVLLLYFFALIIVSLIERNIRLNMKKQKIEKLPILPQKKNGSMIKKKADV